MAALSTEYWELCGTIADLQERNDLVLITDSQNVYPVLEYIGQHRCMKVGAGIFVKAEDGAYTEIYLFFGIPYIYKPIWRYRKEIP